MSAPSFDPKYDDDKKIYEWDWSKWLGEAETIINFTLDVPAPLTEENPVSTPSTVSVLIGAGTVGDTYTLNCQIETSEGQFASQPVCLEIIPRLDICA